MCAPRKYFFRFANFRVFVRLFFFFRSFFIRTCFHMQNPCAGATDSGLTNTGLPSAGRSKHRSGKAPNTGPPSAGRSKHRGGKAPNTGPPSAGRSECRGGKAPNTGPPSAQPLQMPRRLQSTEHRTPSAGPQTIHSRESTHSTSPYTTLAAVPIAITGPAMANSFAHVPVMIFSGCVKIDIQFFRNFFSCLQSGGRLLF